MSQQRLATKTFRSSFKLIDKDVLRWFPGHMGRGLKQMQQKLRSVDCIIEVHDARIPFSGRNTDFKSTISGIKPHILVLNKVDCIERKFLNRIKDSLKHEYEHILFTNSKDQKCRGTAQLFALAQDLINQSDRFNRSNEEDFCLMVIGVPNVGKSSLINALRVKHLGKGNASQVGASPGITRSVLNKIKLCEKPLFYVLDTPGILTPHIANIESGLKLALCAANQDHLVGEKIMADYLLYWLNTQKRFSYVKCFELSEPSDDILSVLAKISVSTNHMLRIKDHLNQYVSRPDLNTAAKLMIKAFRDGSLGKLMLDENLLN